MKCYVYCRKPYIFLRSVSRDKFYNIAVPNKKKNQQSNFEIMILPLNRYYYHFLNELHFHFKNPLSAERFFWNSSHQVNKNTKHA